MTIYVVGFPVLMLAAVIDASVLSYVSYLNGHPSLLLMIVTSWALLNNFSESLPWAVMGGIFADLLAVTPLGTTSLALCIATLLVGGIFGPVGRRNILFPPLAILLATVVVQVITLGVLIVSGWSVPILGAVLRWVLPTLVFNFLGVIVVFRVMGAVVAFFRPPNVTLDA